MVEVGLGKDRVAALVKQPAKGGVLELDVATAFGVVEEDALRKAREYFHPLLLEAFGFNVFRVKHFGLVLQGVHVYVV